MSVESVQDADEWRRATLAAIDEAEMPVAAAGQGPSKWYKRLLSQPAGIVSLGFLVLVIFVSTAAPLVAPVDPNVQNLRNILRPPGATALLGTDDLGRDVLSRLVYGGRVSLLAVIQASGIAVVLGVPLGILAGYIGGRVDGLIMTINDALMSFPALLLAIAVVAALGPGLTNAMLAVGIVYAPRMLRIARASTLGVKEETYVEASRSIGASTIFIIRRHVLRNIRSPLLVEATLLAGRAMLAEASLSFLGLGAQYPDASWGAMLGRSFGFIDRAPMLLVYPGIAIALTVWALNTLGDSLRDAFGAEAH
jgi:ABC-type dipeptide/oligopeptide/nickel transport system permease subunit